MSDQEEENTIEDQSVIAKYKAAGDIANQTLEFCLKKCVVGASVRQICIEGDDLIRNELSAYHKKDKKLKKGIAFPVCISVNECISHYSPLMSDPDTLLVDNDVVKIDLGVHIDEFIAVVAHTIVIGASISKKVTGRQADVILAAHYAAEACLRLVKPGNENYAVTDTVGKIADAYNCKPVEGRMSFQLQQGRIEGDKTIVQNPTDNHRKEIEKCEFDKHEVYGVDVFISTGDGVGREMEARTTIYKRTDENYSLKLKTSREFYSKVQKQHGFLPFNLRHLDDERKARLGVFECVTHRLIDPYPSLYEKPGEFVAQFKFTVLLLPSGPQRITGHPLDTSMFESQHQIEDEDLKKLLATKSGKSAKKKKKPEKKTDVDTNNGNDKAGKATNASS